MTPLVPIVARAVAVVSALLVLLPMPGCARGTPDDPQSRIVDSGPMEDALTGELDATAEPHECVPDSDQVLCTAAGIICGPVTVFDNCGSQREVTECGPCPSDHYCDNNSCASYSYSWQAGGWSGCSASCGPGTKTRTVWCERDDGVMVADSKCSASKPTTSASCDAGSCCTPSCASHDSCGGDGCGGDCGSCSGDRWCGYDTYCVWHHGNDGSVTCDTLCAWGYSVCVGTSTHNCSTKNVALTCYCW